MRFFKRRGCRGAGMSNRGMQRQSCPGRNSAGRGPVNLADLKQNERAVIRRSSACGLLGHKLVNMGFIPGAEVHMIRNAPLRDPIEIGIQNYMVTLRRAEAALIEVETA
ncbi:MAG: ferrous iron transport protein A [Desulfuromonadales bacterium]|nr:ferrous iron transport protein A [Desulfuromonadales bacterium]MBN2791388.1 ferrous iron transport protein A [Desulfuromonadales bacterium]